MFYLFKRECIYYTYMLNVECVLLDTETTQTYYSVS